jgi:2-methylfumaryl-CoA hydratase
MTLKSNPGRFFEDFAIGETIVHATPRTVTTGDVALYTGLTGSRYGVFCADTLAQAAGYPHAPLDPVLVFHMVFGKTVPDISLNAVANLGYAEGRFLAPVFPGDTLAATSEVIGKKENSNGKTGVVYVRTTGTNQHGEAVLSYVRWVMVNKADPATLTGDDAVPVLAAVVGASGLVAPPALEAGALDGALTGSGFGLEDYAVGERIDHVDGMTVEEAEHQIATRLYQNTAKVHFDALAQASSRHGKRLIYGGVVISLARALAFNGLGNAASVLAINAGRHVNPLFAGDTVYVWSEVLATHDFGNGNGALRLRHVATRNQPCAAFPDRLADGAQDPAVILDLDCWVAVPVKAALR